MKQLVITSLLQTSIKVSLLFIAIFALALVQPTQVLATNFYYSDQDVAFYDKDAQGVCPAANVGTVGTLSPDAAVQAAVSGAEKHRASYELVGTEKNVPWQMLAAIHYRETGYGTTNPSNGQGIFQFFSLYQAGQRFAPGPVTTAEFERQLRLLADLLKTTYTNTPITDLQSQGLSAANTDARKVKDIFFSYNGRASAYADQAKKLGFNPATDPFEGSPYVMNLADDKRVPKLNPDGWGGFVADGRFAYYPSYNSSQAGAYVVYVGLGGSSMAVGGSSCNSVVITGNDIVDIARQELAKKIIETPLNCDVPNLSQVGSCGPEIDKFTDSHLENWCADFVSWVYKTAGFPFTGGASGGWRLAGVAGIQTWFIANGQYFSSKDTTKTPQPGDVVFFNGTKHIGIVDTVKGDTIITIEGNTRASGFDANGNVVGSHTYNYRTSATVTGFGSLQ
jgi:hypothetical protein